MSSLSVYHQSLADQPNKVLTHLEDIASTLAEVGIGFERFQGVSPVVPGTAPQDVIAACQAPLDQLMSTRGCVGVQVLSVGRERPQPAEKYAGYRVEHRLATDEVRLVVGGRGLFTVHVGDYVYAVQCEKHDLISIPAGTCQWFDLGETPHLVAIRLFSGVDGGPVTVSGDDIASRFPGLDD